MKCEKCGHDPDKIKLLEKQVAELGEIVKEAESEFKTADSIFEMVRKMERTSEKNEKVYEEVQKEHLSKKLEYLRLNTDMIRKISPTSADILTEKINEYEKANRDLKVVEKNFGEAKTKDMTLLAFFGFIGVMMAASQRVEDMVKACSISIHDTIDRVK